MGPRNGARPRKPEFSNKQVVAAIGGRSPRLSDAVAAAARASEVGEISVRRETRVPVQRASPGSKSA